MRTKSCVNSSCTIVRSIISVYVVAFSLPTLRIRSTTLSARPFGMGTVK